MKYLKGGSEFKLSDEEEKLVQEALLHDNTSSSITVKLEKLSNRFWVHGYVDASKDSDNLAKKLSCVDLCL